MTDAEFKDGKPCQPKRISARLALKCKSAAESDALDKTKDSTASKKQTPAKKLKSSSVKTSAKSAVQHNSRSSLPAMDLNRSAVTFEDDENFVSMEAPSQLSDHFPSNTEDGEISGKESAHNESKSDAENSQQLTANSASTRRWHSRTPQGRVMDTESSDESGSPSEGNSSEESEDPRPCTSKSGGDRDRSTTPQARMGVEDTVELMQTFMLQSGLIDEEVYPDELKRLICKKCRNENRNDNHCQARTQGRRLE